MFHPPSTSVDSPLQVAMPAAMALGKLGLAAAIPDSSRPPSAHRVDRVVGRIHRRAVLRLGLGKVRRRSEATRFHTVMMLSIVAGDLMATGGSPNVRSPE